MGRAKLRMELIPKEKTRNTTYHKRKQGMIKKANEFTILCDVDTVIIIYPPNSNSPEIWPENADKVKETISCYKSKSKKGETGKRTYDLNDFFVDRNKKIEEELVKARKRNMEAKYSTWFDEFDGLGEVELRQFAMEIENKENVVRAHLEFKKRNMNVQLPYMFDTVSGSVSGSGVDHYGQVMGQHHGGGWVGGGPSYIPLREMGYGYPVGFDGGVGGYDGGNGQWGYQPPQMVHGGGMVEFGKQEQETEALCIIFIDEIKDDVLMPMQWEGDTKKTLHNVVVEMHGLEQYEALCIIFIDEIKDDVLMPMQWEGDTKKTLHNVVVEMHGLEQYEVFSDLILAIRNISKRVGRTETRQRTRAAAPIEDGDEAEDGGRRPIRDEAEAGLSVDRRWRRATSAPIEDGEDGRGYSAVRALI
ncbi:hypothetical protein SSX86_018849 [Deinandra increscens subsp. villosa]|uniref:MADS-box domain-containing protein n=1 Tax=Deinandra increscens subsp. villosa TaxID=3103831 RepID=A0AAP0GTX3_9ASTR